MRSLRQKAQLRQQKGFKGFGTSVKKTEPVVQQKPVQEEKKKKHEVKRMEEEDESEEIESNDNSIDEETEEKEEPVQMLEQERKEIRGRVAADTMDELRPNGKLYIAIKDRYQELLKELWKSQSKLEEFGFNSDEKKILNDRVKIWLEYFAITSAFRDENVNLFEYIDSFCDTQKFI